jgi:hypothetical protein
LFFAINRSCIFQFSHSRYHSSVERILKKKKKVGGLKDHGSNIILTEAMLTRKGAVGAYKKRGPFWNNLTITTETK